MDYMLPMPTEEQAAEMQLEALRQVRNEKLLRCDWTQMADNGMSDTQRAEWQTYRQRLRDITNHFINRSEVEWPELGQETWPTG